MPTGEASMHSLQQKTTMKTTRSDHVVGRVSPRAALWNSKHPTGANRENRGQLLRCLRSLLFNLLVIMPTARVGAPFLSRSLSFLFGALVSVPDIDEFGVPLSTVNTNVTPNRPVQLARDYWLAEP